MTPTTDHMAPDMRAALIAIENPPGTARESGLAVDYELAGDTRPFHVEISKLPRLTEAPGLSGVMRVKHIPIPSDDALPPALEILVHALDYAVMTGELAEAIGYMDRPLIDNPEGFTRSIEVYYRAPAENGGDQ